jgi:hypothetical protein
LKPTPLPTFDRPIDDERVRSGVSNGGRPATFLTSTSNIAVQSTLLAGALLVVPF